MHFICRIRSSVIFKKKVITTKKVIANLTKQHELNLRPHFLSPDLNNIDNSNLLSLDKGDSYDKGYIIFIGTEITAKDFLARYFEPIKKKKNAIKTIESYFKEINKLKVGNIVSIDKRNKSEVVVKLLYKSHSTFKKNI